jgi:rsbT antagonist protein RsbS
MEEPRTPIHLTRIPILQIQDFLVASVQTALHDQAATQFRDDLLLRIYETKAKGLILDLTAMDVVDSFIAKLTGDIAEMAALMGTRVVVTGLQPAVAVTLVELGVELRGVVTALNLEKGIEILRRLDREDSIRA